MTSEKSIEKKKDNLMKSFVDELPVLRARLGVSQAEIAEIVGISRQSFNAIETGKKKMNWTVFIALVSVFQGNNKTKQMLDSINGFSDDLQRMIEI